MEYVQLVSACGDYTIFF